MLLSHQNLEQNLVKSIEGRKLKGDNFNELYHKKRSLERVANHEGIKKTSVARGNLRKNIMKAYHYEPYKYSDPPRNAQGKGANDNQQVDQGGKQKAKTDK